MRWKPRHSAAEEQVAAKLRAASKFYKFLWEISEETVGLRYP